MSEARGTETTLTGAGPGLVVRKEAPFNAETPMEAQTSVITPVDQFYVRNHFPIPALPDILDIDGAVDAPALLCADDIRRLPKTTRLVTVECAGNGRAFLDPPTSGVPWVLGAVGTASWTGTMLSSVLQSVGLRDTAVEIQFEGADRGTVEAAGGDEICYGRSLRVGHAMGDVIIAYEMNGQPLTPEHGAPLRLIVPGWYGMASVKWLTRIRASTEPYLGHFQVKDYVVNTDAGDMPCQDMAVRAVITRPSDGTTVGGREITVSGFAWSGVRSVVEVDVSADNGMSWAHAKLEGLPDQLSVWQRWSFIWRPARSGIHTLLARARDDAGRTQPRFPIWNSSGYGNNAVAPILVEVALK